MSIFDDMQSGVTSRMSSKYPEMYLYLNVAHSYCCVFNIMSDFFFVMSKMERFERKSIRCDMGYIVLNSHYLYSIEREIVKISCDVIRLSRF